MASASKRAVPAKPSAGRRKSLWDIAIDHDLIPVDFSAALLALLCIAPSCYFYTQIRSGRGLKKQLLSCATLAGLGFFATLKTIPYVMRKIPGFLTGKDLCRNLGKGHLVCTEHRMRFYTKACSSIFRRKNS